MSGKHGNQLPNAAIQVYGERLNHYFTQKTKKLMKTGTVAGLNTTTAGVGRCAGGVNKRFT